MEEHSTLKIGVLPSPNYLEIKRTVNHGVQLSGFQGKILAVILENLGFKYEFIVPEIRMWGHRKEDGNWTGLIGLVNTNEADMALSTIGVSEDRSKAVDFSNPFTIEGCPQAAIDIDDSSAKSKLLLAFWWPFSMILSFSYSAALLSFLTIPLQEETIKDFRELAAAVESGSHRCYSILESDIVTYLINSEKPHYTSLGRTIIRNDWFYSFTNIKEGRYISRHSVELISRTSATLLYGTGQYHPNILISKDTLALWPIAVALSKKFCCKSKVNKVISRLLSSGIPSKFLADESFKIHLVDERERTDTKSTKVKKQLSVKDISGTLMLLGSGYITSLVVLAGEIIYARIFTKK
ncbi:PBPe domain-containing protein [Trichonephila clavata]|uniref:PBPe domain-containing protein n=1 Tax=Trichonephila clavata TaxID=2740835 RepID=A0A8X6H7K4_TRICU|nr:PBPe domain-containing protein [Trichonephila clavata]